MEVFQDNFAIEKNKNETFEINFAPSGDLKLSFALKSEFYNRKLGGWSLTLVSLQDCQVSLEVVFKVINANDHGQVLMDCVKSLNFSIDNEIQQLCYLAKLNVFKHVELNVSLIMSDPNDNGLLTRYVLCSQLLFTFHYNRKRFSRMASSFGNDKLSDVQVELSSGARIPCHKYVLALRSDVLETMVGYSDDIIKVDDFDDDVIRAMIKFLYTDQVELVLVNVDLLLAADKYNIKKLIHMTKDHLIGTSFIDKC
jgi:hypothetical protein